MMPTHLQKWGGGVLVPPRPPPDDAHDPSRIDSPDYDNTVM